MVVGKNNLHSNCNTNSTVCNKQGIHVIIIIILKYIKNELRYNFAFCFVYIIY